MLISAQIQWKVVYVYEALEKCLSVK